MRTATVSRVAGGSGDDGRIERDITAVRASNFPWEKHPGPVEESIPEGMRSRAAD